MTVHSDDMLWDGGNPGSSLAIQNGCTCAVMDNHNGGGFQYCGTTCFWISEGCPIHGTLKKENENENEKV